MSTTQYRQHRNDCRQAVQTLEKLEKKRRKVARKIREKWGINHPQAIATPAIGGELDKYTKVLANIEALIATTHNLIECLQIQAWQSRAACLAEGIKMHDRLPCEGIGFAGVPDRELDARKTDLDQVIAESATKLDQVITESVADPNPA